jgi:hypothetical protein
MIVLVIFRACEKGVFCVYPEPERRVFFVVCFGYIQSLKEECFLLFVLVISRA